MTNTPDGRPVADTAGGAKAAAQAAAPSSRRVAPGQIPQDFCNYWTELDDPHTGRETEWCKKVHRPCGCLGDPKRCWYPGR